MNGGPIEVCPMCNYSLAGLPRDYQCPECGFLYDQSMRIWRGRSVWVYALLAGSGAIFAACAIVSLFVRLPLPGCLGNCGASLLFLTGIVAAYHGLRSIRGPFVIVGAKEIQIQSSGFRKVWTIPLAELHIYPTASGTSIWWKDEEHPMDRALILLSRKDREELHKYITEKWEKATGEKAEFRPRSLK